MIHRDKLEFNLTRQSTAVNLEDGSVRITKKQPSDQLSLKTLDSLKQQHKLVLFEVSLFSVLVADSTVSLKKAPNETKIELQRKPLGEENAREEIPSMVLN